MNISMQAKTGINTVSSQLGMPLRAIECSAKPHEDKCLQSNATMPGGNLLIDYGLYFGKNCS